MVTHYADGRARGQSVFLINLARVITGHRRSADARDLERLVLGYCAVCKTVASG
jgi:hypothetical protein